ncbi:MAG TPA: GNAT family N-acetyltransferase [Candidatus Polarisedimenticolaceae bacterium]|nr:GNAT family N-acetyltransferase [Candidatus Polarisedimenticolaceae bacterium]
MRLLFPGGVLRSFRHEDALEMARHADNPNVWVQLRDAFPHPYRLEDARRFLEAHVGAVPETVLAIEVHGGFAGSVGLKLGMDVERVSAEIGYWVAEPFWGRGIATGALVAATDWAFGEWPLTRIFAVPFARNAASVRVLEKAGYVLEGRMVRSAVKQGEVLDQLLYAAYRTGP